MKTVTQCSKNQKKKLLLHLIIERVKTLKLTNCTTALNAQTIKNFHLQERNLHSCLTFVSVAYPLHEVNWCSRKVKNTEEH